MALFAVPLQIFRIPARTAVIAIERWGSDRACTARTALSAAEAREGKGSMSHHLGRHARQGVPAPRAVNNCYTHVPLHVLWY
jgi:hypothetical protein